MGCCYPKTLSRNLVLHGINPVFYGACSFMTCPTPMQWVERDSDGVGPCIGEGAGGVLMISRGYRERGVSGACRQ